MSSALFWHKTGFNVATQAVAGRYGSVIVHAGVGLQHYQASFLLDMTDDTTSFYDPWMRFGEWWDDPSGALSLRVRPGAPAETILVDVILDDGINFYNDPTPAWVYSLIPW